MSYASNANISFPKYNPVWDLESIFPGGVESKAFQMEVEAVDAEIAALRARVRTLVSLRVEHLSSTDAQAWASFLLDQEQLDERLREVSTFAHCVASASSDDPRALRMPGLLNESRTQFGSMMVDIRAMFRGLSDSQFEKVHGLEALSAMDLVLREMRRDADNSMDPELEALAVELKRDGLHGWGALYSQVSARLEVEIEDSVGKKTVVSVGQARNMAEDPDRDVRRRTFEGLTASWQTTAPVCAAALNSIIGSEKSLYRRRGGDALTDPLQKNRMKRESVDAMMAAAASYQDVLVEYMQLKASYLGVEKLAWYDLSAPVGEGAREDKISYEDAQEFIVEQIGKFSQPMADFCKHAFVEQWVEAEYRSGKRQGGYCATFSAAKQVRVFMTFGGTAAAVQTLAHELGHGYHSWIMRNMAASETDFPSTLAETASTLAEALVEEAALKLVTGNQKLRLLDERLQRAVTFLMNVPARYRLELAMHEKRAEGELDEDVLSGLTREIFGEAFGDGVEAVDALFWASKLHFYMTQRPFYNFPYTFGYLFSKALYTRAELEGPSFARVVDNLLKDTGRMTVEEIAAHYLDADVTQEAFWKDAAASIEGDVAEYRALVQASKK